MARLRWFYEVDKKDWFQESISDKAEIKVEKSFERENIRQWILRELNVSYNYPRDWIGKQIILSDNIKNVSVPNFFGIALLTHDGHPFAWISVSGKEENNEALKNLRALLLASKTAGYGISTDGSKDGTYFLRRRFDSDKLEFINDIEPFSSPGGAIASHLYLFNFDGKNAEKHKQIVPIDNRIENIFFEAHSHIRDIDGLHADEALDELCKMLYVKMYDEESANPSEPVRFQKWLYGSSEELAATIRALYTFANEYDKNKFCNEIPEYGRSRGVFNLAIRLSSVALSRVVETLQSYSLVASNTDVKGRAFQNVLVPALRSGMGQYFTPEPIIDFMVRVANPLSSDLILDPFCGSGRFLSKCLQVVRNRSSQIDEIKLHEFAFSKLHGIEKSDRMVRIAMTDMRLNGDGHCNIRCTDALLDFANYHDLHPESFDLILTNPPFGSLLRADAIAQLGTFVLSLGKRSVPLEILGLERCMQFLRPGGRLGIVLPESIIANRSANFVRKWMASQAKLRAIISLPIETFSPFGANIKTSILFARKWHEGESIDYNYPVFMSRVDSIGYDATGRISRESELNLVAEQLSSFLDKEGW